MTSSHGGSAERRPGPRARSLGAVALASTFGLIVVLAGCTSAGTDASGPTSTTKPPARASAGCGKAPAVTATDRKAPGDVPLTIAVGQQQRSYRLGVPSSYDQDTPAPEVLDLHGSGGSAAEQDAVTAMPMKAAERGFITVTPDAVAGKWELASRGPDAEFLTALLDDVAGRYCVDLDRVFAVGHSLGAWKTAVTACADPDRFASIALVSVEVHPGGCGPIPVVAFHGTADGVVPYGAGADAGVVVTGSNSGLPGVEVNMPEWAAGAHCSVRKKVQRIEPDVEHWTYTGCDAGTGVEFYSIEHGSHMWPGSPIALPGTTHTIDATKLALDWFDAHPKRSESHRRG